MRLTIGQRTTLVTVGKALAFSGAVLAATWLTRTFDTVASASTAAFVFLILVLLAGYFGNLAVALATSVAATLCYDYFYLPPVGTLAVDSFADWISLATFLLASAILSRLTASAAAHARKTAALEAALARLQTFGEWFSSAPEETLSLCGIAERVLRVFSLTYCAIHVYGEGKWQHHSGSASSDVAQAVETRLAVCQDHRRILADLAEEDMLGVRYVSIMQGEKKLAILAFKGEAFPAEAAGALAGLVGMRLGALMRKGCGQ